MRPTNRKSVSVAILALLPMVVPLGAQAFTGKAGTRVLPVNQAVFEVVPRGGNGPGYWCGASDYALRTQGADWRATLTIVRGLGPSVTTGKRSAVQFTLDPTAAGVTPTGPALSHNTLKTGESMSVQQAYFYCDRSRNNF